MATRRDFLTTVGAGLGAAVFGPAGATGAPEARKGPVGLQLYSLREQFRKDVPAALAWVRSLGIQEVETAGTWGQTAAEHRAALDRAGLRCQASHTRFERLQSDPAAAFAEVKTLGATWTVCPWIPHGETFTRNDALKAGEAFDRFARAGKEEGLHFAYHCHGYEFLPSPEGTLFDSLVAATDPALVSFEIDVFWVTAGGGDPVKVIEKLPGRVAFLHVKDMKKGLSFPAGTSRAPGETNVPVGTGQIDWPRVLRAAAGAGALVYYIEDESPDPMGQIPQSLEYLAGMGLVPRW
jgi:sugar phosphate isomerase/epimerase